MYKSNIKYFNSDKTRNSVPLAEDSYYCKIPIKKIMLTVMQYDLEQASSIHKLPQWVLKERLAPYKSFAHYIT